MGDGGESVKYDYGPVLRDFYCILSSMNILLIEPYDVHECCNKFLVIVCCIRFLWVKISGVSKLLRMVDNLG